MKALSSLACLLLLAPTSRADDLSKLNGAWEGLLKVSPAVELRLVIRIEANPGAPPKVTMDSPDQGAKGIPVEVATLDQGAVRFESKTVAGSFKGKLAANGKSMDGEWAQAGMTWPLTLKKTDGAEVPAEVWEGALEMPNTIKLRILFHLTAEKDGTFRATMDSPDQGAAGIKVDAAEKKDGALKFTLKAIEGEYSGRLNKEGTEAVGNWTQAGNVLPLTLKKVAKPTAVKRPQEPKPPFPYEVEEVSYQNPAAKNTLGGTLTRPKADGPVPVVLLITGSGMQDRDETLLGHKPFWILADALTRRGIAVLRVDDRGVGKSTGDFAQATSEDFAGDVLAGVAYLKTRKEFDPKAIGLVGHSEGGLIAPMVATRSDDVAFLVLMAGTGLTGAEILEMQSGLILQAIGASEDKVKLQREIIRKLTGVVRDEADNGKAQVAMKTLVTQMITALPEEDRKALSDGVLEKSLDAQLKTFTSPWFRYFLTFDPRPTLQKVHCPVLAINGEKDLQVPPKENLAEIAQALKTGGNTRFTTKELPGLNHLFQASKTGAPSEYGAIEETINPAALQVIGDWILETARPAR